MMNMHHKIVHPVTFEVDKYIESWNSILEREVIRKFEFDTFEKARATTKMYIDFYYNEILHFEIGYTNPEGMNIKCIELKQKN